MAASSVKSLSPVAKTQTVIKRQKKTPEHTDPTHREQAQDESSADEVANVDEHGDPSETEKKDHIDTYV